MSKIKLQLRQELRPYSGGYIVFNEVQSVSGAPQQTRVDVSRCFLIRATNLHRYDLTREVFEGVAEPSDLVKYPFIPLNTLRFNWADSVNLQGIFDSQGVGSTLYLKQVPKIWEVVSFSTNMMSGTDQTVSVVEFDPVSPIPVLRIRLHGVPIPPEFIEDSNVHFRIKSPIELKGSYPVEEAQAIGSGQTREITIKVPHKVMEPSVQAWSMEMYPETLHFNPSTAFDPDVPQLTLNKSLPSMVPRNGFRVFADAETNTVINWVFPIRASKPIGFILRDSYSHSLFDTPEEAYNHLRSTQRQVERYVDQLNKVVSDKGLYVLETKQF